MSDRLDRRLDSELPALLTEAQPPPDARYLAVRNARPRWRLRLASLPAAVGTKLLVGAGAVALAGAGVGIKTAVTGSPSPLIWSNGAQPVVQQCMATATPGQGIGACARTALATGHPGTGPLGSAAGSHAPRTGAPSLGVSPTSTPPGRSDSHPTPHPHPSHRPKPTPAATAPPRSPSSRGHGEAP